MGKALQTVHASLPTPRNVTIEPHRMGLAFGADTPRYWCDNDPVLTHFLNALSLSFPEGERFFVEAVRNFRDRVEDPQRQKDISGFIGQEAMHSLEHTSFNRFLDSLGYGEIPRSGEGMAKKLLKGLRIRTTKQELLAATAAFEHITAILADGMLRDTKYIGSIHPNVRPLWMWHAIEETEHKAVAFDLYQDVDGRVGQRNFMLAAGSVYLALYTGTYMWKFLKHDKVHRRPLVMAKGLWKLLGPDGIVTRIVPDFLDFFSKDFHPWQQENSHLIKQWRAELERLGQAGDVA